LIFFRASAGFSLGLERAKCETGPYDGFETVAFCEIEAFPRKVLAKHWPNVPCYHDVRTLTAERLAADGIAVDVICGGFPCQDVSFAGLGAGLAGARSGLFYEIARLVGELGPSYVILENVGALLSRGLDAVLGTLASLGYDAEWHCIPASAVGAPHRRDRVWIIAHPHSHPDGVEYIHAGEGRNIHVAGKDGAYPEGELRKWGRNTRPGRNGPANGSQVLANAISIRQQGQGKPWQPGGQATIIDRQTIDAFASGVRDFWSIEPNVGRVANGVPDRSHRLKGLGNAVVPQIPELIGNAILEAL